MKILITGANGYLGQGIISRVLDKGHQVVAADFVTDKVDDRAEKRNCNLFHVNNPYVYFGEPEAVLHLAWRDGFLHYSDTHIEDFPKHYHFVKTMIEAGIKKIAVMGSMHEIGFFEGSINENTPCHPVTPYGISKNALRDAAKMLATKNGIALQWFRGYYIVGNCQYGSSIFSKIAMAAKEGKKEFPFTQGQNQYDFIDYDDFCNQVTAAMTQEKINGIINICSGKPEKLADRVERFIQENRYDIRLKYGAFPDRPYDSKAVWGDDGKIAEVMRSVK